MTFFLLRLIPGDPALAILGSSYTKARAVAIDATPRPGQAHSATQYGLYMGTSSAATWASRSSTASRPHGDRQPLPPTLFLVVYAAVMAAVISLPIGFISACTAVARWTRARGCSSRSASRCRAFWLGIILILIFTSTCSVFPLSGFGRGFFGHLYSLFLPALTIALGFSTVLVRSLRASTIAALQSEFIDTARMKGVRWQRVLWRHVFRNSVLAVVAVYGVNLAYLISGTVMVENVFSLPGLGTLLVNSVSSRDYPVVQGVTLLFAVLIVLINLLTDLTQAALDPRVGQEIGG